MECRSGTVYLSASLGWVAGLYRFFLLGSVGVGTVRLKWWGAVVRFSGRLQFAVCFLGRWLFVVGLPFTYNNFSLILVLFVGFVYYKLLISFDSLQVVEEGYGPGGL